jgi:DNA helicase-2/ATP-dependent DNA helicase PcrA
MIHQFVNKPELCPEFEAVFIDEAQDLSPLQWQMYDLLKTKSKDIYLAGDDDQAIYQWAGADVDRFINEPGEEIFLTQSHRIPVSVQEISKTIINRIQGLRVDKKYLPREEQGEAKAIYNLHNVDLHKGNWLVLARTGTRLKDIMQDLESKGIYYQTKKGKSYGVKLYKAILNYTKWTNGLDLTENESKDIKDYTGDKVWSKDLFWYEIFDKVSLDQKNYIRLMLANKENLNDEARVKLSTIHAAKGGEEDNVVLILDNARKIRQAVQRSVKKRDEEHRVWYVGATRARNNLYLLKAKIERYGYQL